MDDLVPVATTISNQLVLAVNPKAVPVNDFPAFVEFARKPATVACFMPRSATAAITTWRWRC